MHKGLQLKINVTQGGNTEERILDLKQKSPGDWLQFEPYKKYDITVGTRNRMEGYIGFKGLLSAPVQGNFSFWVRSYETDGVETRPLPWNIVGYSETGATGPFTSTPPEWLQVFKSNGNGVSNPTNWEALPMSISDQTYIITPNPRIAALQNKSEVGSQTEPIDLSRVPVGNSPFFSIADNATASTYEGNPMNTANCYVVTRPGWYKIPVVYGNAIKGTDSEKERANTEAYNSSVSYPNNFNFLKPFIRHDGQDITDPWIKNNSGINLNSGIAELVWQDQPNLVQNIQLLQPDQKYIVFHVSQANIHEGNAVIALKNSATGDIVWSWHLWVTASNMKSINVKNNKAKAPSRPGQDNFNFLSENLGACYDGNNQAITYFEKNAYLKISNGRKTAVMHINRRAVIVNGISYNCTYYQWGRKDPMLPSNGTDNNKIWYNKDGGQSNVLLILNWVAIGGIDPGKEVILSTIKKPHAFYPFPGMDDTYYNLWNAYGVMSIQSNNINSAEFRPTIKTVYDPCPPGFCLPPNGAFTGFTKTGEEPSTSLDVYISGSFDKGWHFRTVLKGEPDAAIDPTIFFPASGCRRNKSGDLTSVGSYGYYWSSIPPAQTSLFKRGCMMLLNGGIVYPLSCENRGSGFVVRPVKE